jgi:hypothetical protein
MADPFSFSSDSAGAPSRLVAAVTPSDTVDLTDIPKALWVAVAGTVNIVGVADASNAGTAMGSLPVGTVIPVRARRVRATGTTASLVAMY